MFTAINLRSEPIIKTLEKAQKLVEQYKFASAFDLLQKADHTDSSATIQLAKEKIALQYFVKSFDHRVFGLRDLKHGENLDKLHDTTTATVLFTFPVDSILEKLIDHDSSNCELYKGLADYYYDISLRFDNWVLSKAEIADNAIGNYVKAIANGCKDFKTYYNLGLLNIQHENIKAGIDAMEHAVKLDSMNADARYNLAFALILGGKKDSALPHALFAYKLYSDPITKSDAARMLGDLYEFKHQDSTALYYLRVSDTLDPNSYYTLKAEMEFFIKRDMNELAAATDRFFAIDPENPGIYNDLTELYTKYDKINKLLDFFNEKIKYPGFGTKVKASLEFYIGRIYMQIGDGAKAKEYMTKSREHFGKVLNPDDQVFTVIDKVLKQLDDN